MAEAVAVDVGDLTDDDFHAFDGLGLVEEVVELVEGAFALLFAELFLELFDGS